MRTIADKENVPTFSLATKAAKIAHYKSHNEGQGPKRVLNNVTTTVVQQRNPPPKDQIDLVVESVENATKRFSQHSQNSQISKRKVENRIGPWRLGRTLGKGSTGRVRLARHSSTGTFAAIKIIPKHKNRPPNSKDISSSGLPYGIEREIIIMKLISHPNIMALYDVWENDNELYLVLEYVEGGELFDFIINNGKLNEADAVKYFRMIINGVSYCHKFNICHRDLKPENILLDKNFNIKIADFGMAALETKQRLLETSCGSPHYASPEIVAGQNYHGSPSDVWSCGIILFALLTGHLPFDDKNIRKLLLKVQSGKFRMPQNLSVDAKDLIWSMLRTNPKERIPINEIVNHPLMKKYPVQNEQPIINKLENIDITAPIPNIDSDILHNLQTLWHGIPKSRIIMMLKNQSPNSEKMFYYLLKNYKLTHKEKLNKEILIKKSPSQLRASLPRSVSTVKTVIENEEGEVLKSVTQEFKPTKPTSATHKRKSNVNIRGIVASSSRKGLSQRDSTLSIINMHKKLSIRLDSMDLNSGSSNDDIDYETNSSSTYQHEAEIVQIKKPTVLPQLNEYKYLMNSIFDDDTQTENNNTNANTSASAKQEIAKDSPSLSKLEMLKKELTANRPPSQLRTIRSSSTRKLSNFLDDQYVTLKVEDFNDNMEHQKANKHKQQKSIDSSYLNLSYSFHSAIPMELKSPKEDEIVHYNSFNDCNKLISPNLLNKEVNGKLSIINESRQSTPAVETNAQFQTDSNNQIQLSPRDPVEKSVRNLTAASSKFKTKALDKPKPMQHHQADVSIPSKKKSWFKKLFEGFKLSSKSKKDERGPNRKIKEKKKPLNDRTWAMFKPKKEYWLESDILSGEEFENGIKQSEKFGSYSIKCLSLRETKQVELDSDKIKIKIEIVDKVGDEYGFGGIFVKLSLVSGKSSLFDKDCHVLQNLISSLENHSS